MTTLTSPNYEAHKTRAAVRSRRISATGRDIGSLPPIRNPRRRRAASADFRIFCEEYFPHVFTLAWSADHLKAISKTQRCVDAGGLFAFAMPRGNGKTSLCETAALFGLVTGRRAYCCLIGAGGEAAGQLLASIKTELETNQLLLDDFPEVCYPIRALEGIAQRAGGQRYRGERTHIGFTSTRIILPTIRGSQASGSIVEVAGITGRIRGMKHKRPTGENVRPDIVIIDDPQTDESANSPSQCAKRLEIINKAILGLAGPGKKIAALMPTTVIAEGDLADQILDPQLNPRWQGERAKMLASFPDNLDLWDRYNETLTKDLQAGGDGSKATKYYKRNRKAMDAGAKASWPERKDPGELSAIQHAMNLYLRDEASFFSEMQNDPRHRSTAGSATLTPAGVNAKRNGLRRYQAPEAAQWVTSYIDVQKTLLYFLTAAWTADGSGYVVDYGTWPDQRASYFTLSGARRTLATATPRARLDGQIFAGLRALIAQVRAQAITRLDGATMRPNLILIDSGYEPDIVHAAAADAPGPDIMPARGVGLTASNKPFSDYNKTDGLYGANWRIPKVTGRRALRVAHLDTNHYKSRVRDALLTAEQDAGAITFFGRDEKGRKLAPSFHRMIADHVAAAEYYVTTQGRGRTVDEWKLRPHKPDNHGFDCLVGSTAGASILGANPIKQKAPATKPTKKRKRVSYL